MPTGEACDVVLCLPHMRAGGSERVAAMLANAWAGRGLRVGLVTIESGSSVYRLDPAVRRFAVADTIEHVTRPSLRENPAEVLRDVLGPEADLGASGMSRIVERSWALRTVLRAVGARVVLAILSYANVLAILASAGQTWRLVVSERTQPELDGDLPDPFPALRRQLYGRANLVTANSQAALRAMAPYVDTARLAYLPNPLVLPDPASVPPVGERAPELLAVGRLQPVKGYDLLLRALAGLPDALQSWRLVMVGDGPLRSELQEQATSLGIADRIRWTGWIDDLAPWYAAAGIFVQPSRCEGLSNALLEAMSFGLAPVVSDSSGGNVEVVRHGETGLVVPTEDVPALTAALTRLAGDAGLRIRLGAAAMGRVREFSLPSALVRWDQALGLDGTARDG